MFDQLLDYCELHYLFVPAQFSFRRGNLHPTVSKWTPCCSTFRHLIQTSDNSFKITQFWLQPSWLLTLNLEIYGLIVDALWMVSLISMTDSRLWVRGSESALSFCCQARSSPGLKIRVFSVYLIWSTIFISNSNQVRIHANYTALFSSHKHRFWQTKWLISHLELPPIGSVASNKFLMSRRPKLYY